MPQSTSYSSHAADPRQIAAEVVEIAGLGGMSVQLQGIENIRHLNILGLRESG